MHPLDTWPLQARSRIAGVFTDIDDTLTTAGNITPDALSALAALKEAGLQVIAITGRPAGWSEPFARSWPVDAIVAESGAVLLQAQQPKDPQKNGLCSEQLLKTYQQSDGMRATNRLQMQRISQRVQREVSGAMPAQDSAGRETDLAIDHSECTQLTPEKIAQVVAILHAEGMNATVSSIHINGWFGEHNKLVGARWAVQALYGRELDDEMEAWAFVGDSTNDQLMFKAFPQSVGVANVQRFAAQLSHLPRYITQGERGAGFAEVAKAILSARTR